MNEQIVIVDCLKKTITSDDIKRLEQLCYENSRQEQLYNIRNDAKLRAVYTTKSYDEFKDIVDAAHLKSVDKFDKSNAKTKQRLWNSVTKD